MSFVKNLFCQKGKAKGEIQVEGANPKLSATSVVSAVINIDPQRLLESVGFDHFQEAVKELGLFWLVVNLPPPADCFRP